MDETALLKELGFSLNEAKVYIALLKKSPMNGYEIAKKADITRTMVYDVLGRLERKKAIMVIPGETKLYKAVEGKTLVGRLKKAHEEKIGLLEDQLEEIGVQTESADYILNISNHADMVREIGSRIRECRKELYISFWAEEALMFEDELRAADARGVDIFFFSFNKIPLDFGRHFTYNMTDVQTYFPRRRIVAVFDRNNLVIGEGNGSIQEVSIVTSNTMLVDMAIDQMILDILLLHTLRNGNYIGENPGIDEYRAAVQAYQRDIKLPAEIPNKLGKKDAKDKKD